jgi:2'-5' RNA ligase
MRKDQFLYFFALVPPVDIQNIVTEIKQDFRERFNTNHALNSPPHITLIPPFMYEKINEYQLIESLEEFSNEESKFQQKLEGFGMFPPRVIFIKVNKTRSLISLYFRFKEHMDKALKISSSVRRTLKFSPHMTVAFRDLTKENFYLAKPVYEKKEIFLEFDVEGISLLRHNRLRWEIIHSSHFKH